MAVPDRQMDENGIIKRDLYSARNADNSRAERIQIMILFIYSSTQIIVSHKEKVCFLPNYCPTFRQQ
jgi:hypothetical protein